MRRKKMDTKIIKKVCFVVTLTVSGLTIGCSQNKTTKTESESIDLFADVGVDVATTEPEESIVSSDRNESSDPSLSEILDEQSKDNQVTEKQTVIDQLKKQAEENAEKDCYNIIEALGDAESDERWSAANQFIQDRYPDYFSSKELLQSSIEYGHYLASLYKDYEGQDNGWGRYYEMGKLVSETAQNVYLGINKSEDEVVVEKMQKLEEQLEFFYDKYYGKLSADK